MNTATWTPLYWEPVSGTLERLMAGVIVKFDGHVTVHKILRDDVLDSLYGKTAGNPKKLIDSALEIFYRIAQHAGPEAIRTPIMGLHPGETRTTQADSALDAVRIAALMFSSLANLDSLDESDSEDAPSQEESSRTLVTEVKSIVVARRPALKDYFNRQAKIFEDGEPVRIGFMSPRALIHYGVLHPVRQPSSVRDARARIFELSNVAGHIGIQETSLVIAVPRQDDATLGTKQREAARRNQREIEREAEKANVRLRPVTTAQEAAECTLALA